MRVFLFLLLSLSLSLCFAQQEPNDQLNLEFATGYVPVTINITTENEIRKINIRYGFLTNEIYHSLTFFVIPDGVNIKTDKANQVKYECAFNKHNVINEIKFRVSWQGDFENAKNLWDVQFDDAIYGRSYSKGTLFKPNFEFMDERSRTELLDRKLFKAYVIKLRELSKIFCHKTLSEKNIRQAFWQQIAAWEKANPETFKDKYSGSLLEVKQMTLESGQVTEDFFDQVSLSQKAIVTMFRLEEIAENSKVWGF